MGKRGPKPRYATPEDFGRRVDEYFSSCEEDNIFPDYAGLRVFLNLSQDRIDQLCKADYTGEDSIKYSKILLRARDRRESWLARTATSQPKVAQGCLNALKQQANGGWIDRPQDSGGGAINIVINGASLESIGK